MIYTTMISSNETRPNPSPAAPSSNNQYSIPVLSKVEGVDNQLQCSVSCSTVLLSYCSAALTQSSSLRCSMLSVRRCSLRSPPKRNAKGDEGRLEATWLRSPHLSTSHHHLQVELLLNSLLSIYCRWDIASTSTIHPHLSTVPLLTVHEIRRLSNVLYKLNFFMQNEPNLNICENDITSFLLTTNDQRLTTREAKNKAKRTQNKPIFPQAAIQDFGSVFFQKRHFQCLSYSSFPT